MHFLSLLLAMFAQVSLRRRSVGCDQLVRQVPEHQIELWKTNKRRFHAETCCTSKHTRQAFGDVRQILTAWPELSPELRTAVLAVTRAAKRIHDNS